MIFDPFDLSYFYPTAFSVHLICLLGPILETGIRPVDLERYIEIYYAQDLNFNFVICSFPAVFLSL